MNHIDALVIKEKFVDSTGALHNTVDGSAATVNYPSLVIEMPLNEADPFYKMFETYVVKGNSGGAKPIDGNLRYLDSTNQQVYFTLSFPDLRLYKFTPDKTGTGGVKSVKLEMYNERITFDYSNSVVALRRIRSKIAF